MEPAGAVPIRAQEMPSALVVIGQPVGQSLSPLIQSAAIAAAGLGVPYTRRDVTAQLLPEVLEEFRIGGVGGNVTMPHKEAVFAVTARPTLLATRVGSVNTFWYESDVLCGHNTDVAGALAVIQTLCPDGLVGKRAALLGAGGSAAAVLVALELAGCSDIRIWARTPERARAVAERVQVAVTLAASADSAVDGASLVVNASPAGMSDDAMPIEPNRLGAGTAVFDLVYRPGATAWVRACRSRGLRAEDGLPMLVEQGAAAFRVWFGIEPSLAAMWGALEGRAIDGG